jgi:hypothetical protein
MIATSEVVVLVTSQQWIWDECATHQRAAMCGHELKWHDERDFCGLLSPPKRPDPRSMASPRWSLERGWHELGAQVVVISSLSVMTGCYHLVRINVVCYDQAPIPILGLDAAAGGGQSGVDRLSPKWPIESKHELIMINRR